MTTPLAIFHKKNMNQQPSAAPQCAGKQQKSQWKFPVSKAFYEKIRVRGERILDELGYGAGWMKHLMPHIERYMLTGEKLGSHYAYECMLIVFTCLRFEIDLAIERSAKARARAAERRAMKAASKPATEYIANADSTSTGNGDAGKDMPKKHNGEKGTEENPEIRTTSIAMDVSENRSPETDNFKEQICKCIDENQRRKYGYIDESRDANHDLRMAAYQMPSGNIDCYFPTGIARIRKSFDAVRELFGSIGLVDLREEAVGAVGVV